MLVRRVQTDTIRKQIKNDTNVVNSLQMVEESSTVATGRSGQLANAFKFLSNDGVKFVELGNGPGGLRRE